MHKHQCHNELKQRIFFWKKWQ